MNTKRSWIITVIIIIIFVVGALIYNAWRKKTVDPDTAPVTSGGRTQSVLNVNGLIVKEKLMTESIKPTARLLPDEEVDLSFETSGKIVGIYFEEGSFVKKGDLLAKVNDAPLQAQFARYEAQLQLAQDRVYRQSILLEQDAVSQEAFEQANTELAILTADMEIVKTNIRLTELRAPFDGIIGLRQVSEGSYASPNVVLAKLTKVSPLKVEFAVNESYGSFIRPGQKASFVLDKDTQKFDITIYAVESRIEESTMTFPVRAYYPNQNRELMPGRFANVEIVIQEIPRAIAIPSEALVPELGVGRVFLYKNGRAEPVDVETGLRTDAEIQVVHGLNVGDTIITSGILQLRTGLPVVLSNVD